MFRIFLFPRISTSVVLCLNFFGDMINPRVGLFSFWLILYFAIVVKALFRRLDNILSGSSREFRILCIFFLEMYVAISVWTIFHMPSSLIVFANVVDHGSCLGSLLIFLCSY